MLRRGFCARLRFLRAALFAAPAIVAATAILATPAIFAAADPASFLVVVAQVRPCRATRLGQTEVKNLQGPETALQTRKGLQFYWATPRSR